MATERRALNAGKDLKERRCADFQHQCDTAVGQLQVELELK